MSNHDDDIVIPSLAGRVRMYSEHQYHQRVIERDEARAERNQLATKLSVLDGSSCAEEQKMGNGPCGICKECLRSERDRLKEALTPSEATKYAYMSEFVFLFGGQQMNVPWITIKEIMAAIRDRAALQEAEG